MSFLDRLSRAVTQTVDKGKRELDQMQRINKIKGEIRDLEKKIADLGVQQQATVVQLGTQALEMLKAGTLSSPELQPFVDQVAQFEQEVAAHQATIQEQEAAIEAIKAEDNVPQAEPAQPAAPAAPGTAPAAPQAGAFCPQCGGALQPGAAFCAQCGARLQ